MALHPPHAARPMDVMQTTLEFERAEAAGRAVGVRARVMPPWWTEADEADARSSEFPETPHLTLQPPEPDAPAEEWEPFNRECEELERIGMAHYEANVHRWRCRNCAFWESEDGRAGLCVSYELTEAYDEPPQPTTATDGHDCPGYFSRTGPAA